MAITMDLIRPMTARDVEPAADLLRREGFGERLTFLTWALDQPTISLFLAEHDGRIVGTGVGSAHGNAGWVGVIFVTPDRRGNGLGRQITRTVLDALEARGCRTQVLLASPLGRPIYEREGFTVLDRHVRVSADGLAPDVGPPGPGIRPFAADDLAGVLALDRHVTGEDRAAVLRPVLSSATTFVAVDGAGAVSGYLARAPWRGGALIALDPDDAIRLLEIRRHATGTSGHAGAGVLAGNVVGRERLRAAGWVEELGGFRMIRGEPLDWRPNAIWGLLNGALG
ncbi:MAG TPA: GNAT family N-acetyltransferase [Candidatus Deferrimicrobium sp.]|nr:GNAT family N-acetyltransferase [Candidatus Deferrimicrobium sp.]